MTPSDDQNDQNDQKPTGEEPAPPEAPQGEPQAPAPEAPAESPEGDQAPPQKPPGFFGTLKAMGAALKPLGRKRVLAASITIFGLSMGAVLLFSGWSFWWTSQPSFCAKCHPMQKYVDAWAEGTHGDVNCEECHLTPGLFGFIGGKIAGLQVVMNYVRGNYEDYSFNAAVGNAACLECHESILAKPVHSQTTGVLVSHKDIIENGAKCMSCHSTVGHGEAVPFGSQTHPTMQACLQCHNDQIAPLDCDLCHVGKKPPPTAMPSPPPVMEATPEP